MPRCTAVGLPRILSTRDAHPHRRRWRPSRRIFLQARFSPARWYGFHYRRRRADPRREKQPVSGLAAKGLLAALMMAALPAFQAARAADEAADFYRGKT